nr:unnamed protein product [Digitaria exilis]
MVVGGHRGMGMNAVGAPPGARVGAARERENTLLSFGRAAALAAVAFVEFDVQGAVYERRVTDLLLEEFLSYGAQKESRKVSKPLLRRTGDGRVLNWCTEEDDSLCTLQEVFECYDLHGIVSEVRGVLKSPITVVRAQESNLALLTYGHLNNVWEAVYVQYLMGISGVIVDQVEEISNAVAGFSKPELGQGSAGADRAIHQAFSQQQLGFLLRLIPELIEQRH